MNLIALLALALFPTNDMAFDAVCSGQDNTLRKPKTETLRFSINLNDKTWCNVTNCTDGVRAIAFLDEGRIYLVDTHTEKTMFRIAINRLTGQFANVGAMTGPYPQSSDVLGVCKLEGYTPHGPLPWRG